MILFRNKSESSYCLDFLSLQKTGWRIPKLPFIFFSFQKYFFGVKVAILFRHENACLVTSVRPLGETESYVEL